MYVPHVPQSEAHPCVDLLHLVSVDFRGVGRGRGYGFQIFFIIIFNFSIPKLVSVPSFSLIERVFNFRGVGRGRGQGVGFRFFHCQI